MNDAYILLSSFIFQRWGDGFNKSQEAFEQAVFSHFTDFVPLVYGTKLESDKEERRARKFLFYPLEEFMCQGDPGLKFQQLGHAEEPSQLCGHNFKNGEPTYSCRYMFSFRNFYLLTK